MVGLCVLSKYITVTSEIGKIKNPQPKIQSNMKQ